MNFNSYDAQSKNAPINNANSNAFIVAGKNNNKNGNEIYKNGNVRENSLSTLVILISMSQLKL